MGEFSQAPMYVCNYNLIMQWPSSWQPLLKCNTTSNKGFGGNANTAQVGAKDTLCTMYPLDTIPIYLWRAESGLVNTLAMYVAPLQLLVNPTTITHAGMFLTLRNDCFIVGLRGRRRGYSGMS